MPAVENRPWLGSWPRSRGCRFTSSTNCNSERAARLCRTKSTWSCTAIFWRVKPGSSMATATTPRYGNDCGAADTLIHVDLTLPVHYWRVTKRLIKGLFADPEGWPKDSPLWSSTMSSYKTIPLCHRYVTPRYRRLVAEMAASKRVAHLRSPREMAAFLDDVRNEFTVG